MVMIIRVEELLFKLIIIRWRHCRDWSGRWQGFKQR